uniref:Uncharacterized protein n=1 Tax=Haptolina brevifila TaxID=156173 RepID=A0A7S2GKJ8_9EUKA|mmetsp:Transcript_41321/g.82788  ORF Transcript_41321/g.82788 Transcript_41321/m.82788 type:complete len:163 (+) Transcript_41321:61-549(+)
MHASSHVKVACLLAGDTDAFAASAVVLYVSLLNFVGFSCFAFLGEATEIRSYVNGYASASYEIVIFVLALGARFLLRYMVIHTASALTSTIAFVVSVVLAQLYISVFDHIWWTWYALFGIITLPFGLALHVWYMLERQKVMERLPEPLSEKQPLASSATTKV